MRFILWSIFALSVVFGRILEVTPFGDNSLKIVFDHNITEANLAQTKISVNTSYIQFRDALIPFNKKKFIFKNGSEILIAQNTPKVTRIVITQSKRSDLTFKIQGKVLYIHLSRELQLLREKSAKKPLIPKLKPQKTAIKPPIQRANNGYKIMIDPGHGGKDCGAPGILKVCEKVIVLDVSLLLEKELKARGYTVYMTRKDDTYIDLKRRTELANEKNVHLFVSVHANSIPHNHHRHDIQGVESYFLSTARSDRARNVAEIENKGDVETMNFFSKNSFLNTLNSHRLIASNKLALDIQFGVLNELKNDFKNVVDGGVREGPFWVLAGALMPSVLIELGYNSNEFEAKRLIDKKYQKALAKGIADGIDGFVRKNF
ncbi:MAG: N-acetylmuramoyl-L-alanine amidase [Helicobacter sp.]|nr:N-acetylmuramoyl-L-alanine amidase [Helicobacter sp.]